MDGEGGKGERKARIGVGSSEKEAKKAKELIDAEFWFCCFFFWGLCWSHLKPLLSPHTAIKRRQAKVVLLCCCLIQATLLAWLALCPAHARGLIVLAKPAADVCSREGAGAGGAAQFKRVWRCQLQSGCE